MIDVYYIGALCRSTIDDISVAWVTIGYFYCVINDMYGVYNFVNYDER